MEAVPRLPMIGFELFTTSDKVSFGPKLKQYIASFYQEDPESYNKEIHTLEGLRATAAWPSIDINNCQIMKKYYCQLHFLKSRFQMEEGQCSAVYFAWKDEYTKMSCSVPDINFEIMCMLFNIGAMHSKLGMAETRGSPEGMKIACTHFQCAAWAFSTVRECFAQILGLIFIASEQLRGMQLVCLAQAQECILEKSLLDNRKATIIAKIAAQISDYYRQALNIFQSGDDGPVSDHVYNHKYILQYLQFKIAYMRCIALLFQGQQAEEQQKMGERVAYYQAALDALDDSRKQAGRMSGSNTALFKETLTFTLDVVEGKRKAATNENEFIYHEEVPKLETLPDIKGASLVKGISFSVHDLEVSGPDIFGRLVPMEAHEAASLYSEQKAKMLRKIGECVEARDKELSDFMSSLQLDVLHQLKSAQGLSQDLVDRAASMIARPTATRDLIDAMGKLSNTYQEVEAMLKEIQDLLKEEELAEKDYQSVMGNRPPSIIATDLSREAAKYQEAHGKASDSNLNLHKAMMSHVANLKILAQPLNNLRSQIPSIQLPDPNVDQKILEQMENLVAKVDEMSSQRNNLWSQLRDSMHQDDITGILITQDQSLEVLFQRELDKHKQSSALIEQNLIAQDNICKAIIDYYARFTPSRKYLQDLLHRRNTTISSLISSYDTYDDLLSKATKGIEFYLKLETNVSKLLQRIKSACKVQQEEREQILLKNGHVTVPKQEMHQPDVAITSAMQNKPRLKDYLDSMKDKKGVDNGAIAPHMQYPTSGMYATQPEKPVWIPRIRPAPLGQEVNADVAPCSGTSIPQPRQDYIPQQTGYSSGYASMNTQAYNSTNNSANYGGYGYTQVNYTDKNMDQSLSDKMAALKMQTPSTASGYQQPTAYEYSSAQAYNYESYPTTYAVSPVQPYGNVAQSGYTYSNSPMSRSKQANTNDAAPHQTPNSNYQTVSSTNYPYVTTSEQYTPQANQQQYNPQNSYGNYGTGSQAVTSSTMSYTPTPNATHYNYNSTNSNQQPGSNSQAYVPQQYPQTNQQYPAETTPGYSQQYQQYGQTSTPSYSDNSQYPASNQQQQQYPATTTPNYTNTNLQYPSTTTNQNQPYQLTNTGNYTVPSQQYPVSNTSQQQYAVPSTQYNTNQQYTDSNTTNQANQYYNYNQDSVPANNYNYQQQYYTTTSGVTSIQPTTTYSQADNSQYVQPTYYPQYASTDNSGYNPNISAYANTPSAEYNQQNTASYNQQVPVNTYNYNQASVSTENPPPVAAPSQPIPVKKESSIDLLAGLDFSISQAPLVPQKETKPEIKPVPKIESTTKIEEKKQPVIKIHKKIEKVLRKGEPFKNPDIISQFVQEVDKFEKYVDGVSVKTLSGPSTLDLKWKEIQDCQDNVDMVKKSISVARCYPLKNRSPDILPYDFSRVELSSTKDDYINASHIKDISLYCMDFIVTQAPTSATTGDFWAMVWEQQTEIIVCLLSNAELNEEIYWPLDVGKEILISNKLITLLSLSENENYTERRLSLSIPDHKETRIITLMQFTAWPGSLFPTNAIPFINFLKSIIAIYEQQKLNYIPVLVHCISGVGRSGICCLLLVALMELAAVGSPLPDISGIANKLTCTRKNILRNREHLKFAYTAFSSYLQELRKVYTKRDSVAVEESIPIQQEVVDPLSELDPLWASKRS